METQRTNDPSRLKVKHCESGNDYRRKPCHNNMEKKTLFKKGKRDPTPRKHGNETWRLFNAVAYLTSRLQKRFVCENDDLQSCGSLKLAVTMKLNLFFVA